MYERLYNVINREFTYLVRWDEATVTELTVKAETETAALMKIQSMASIAGFEIIERVDEKNDR